MGSKMVSNREKASRYVAASAETHAAELAANLTELLTPHLARGESLPDIALIMKLLGRRIRVATETMVKADHTHEVELSDDAAPRAARDQASSELRDVLNDLRAATDSVYGDLGLRAFGIAEPAPVDPSVLCTHSERVSTALRDKNLKLEPKGKGVKMDRDVFADQIDRLRPVLAKSLTTVAREAREAESTQQAKNEAIARNDEIFSRTASALSALFELGELDSLAERVRPSTRRPGQIDELPEPAPEPPPAAT